MASAILFIAIALLALLQGGFFSLAGCVCGAIVCVVAGIAWVRRPRRAEGIPVISLLFAGVALAYAASAVVNGASLTTLSETGVWAACAGVSFLSAAQDDDKFAFWMKVFTWFGIVTAIGGVFVCSGLLPLIGGMVDDRLQFSFQYANAAAAWYGICSLLCLLSPDSRLRTFAALPIAALLLTESGGAALAFAVIILVIAFSWVRSSQWERLLQALVQGVLAVALFAFVHVTMSPLALLGLAVVVIACIMLGKIDMGSKAPVNARIASIALAVVVVVGVVVAIALSPERVADAIASFGERTSQMGDGLFLWSTAPLLGVGPDNWQYLYPYIQTASYYTIVVHCSYIQILLDAGVFGLVFFAAACVLGARSLVSDRKNDNARGGWTSVELSVVVFLLGHSLLDFDLQFAALSFVLVTMLSSPSASQLRIKQLKGIVASLICWIVLLPICLVGSMCAVTLSALDNADAAGDYAACERLFEGNPLAQSDVGAQSHYLTALYNEGAYGKVTSLYGQMLAPTSGDTLYAALAYYAQGDQAQATAILIEHLESHPYDTAFLNGAQQLAESYGIDPAQSAHFDAAVARVLQAVGGEPIS